LFIKNLYMKRTALLAWLLLTLFNAFSQSREIRGRITDQSTGQALPDVTVTVRGTSQATRTDADGNFILSVSSAGPVELQVSLVGFAQQTITVQDGTPASISLQRDVKAMDEVVVIGYGAVRKRDLTGSVVSVKSDEIRKVPASNMMESLQGKIAGADITRSSGAAGAGVNITIRGNRSLRADNSPLIIVDGVQYNSIQDINPNDIQSLEVLKDAASTAIYGSRGANGVIIVTTKKGTTGKPRISASSYYGVSEISEYPRFMNTQEYVEFRRAANRRITEAGINTGGVWTGPANDNLLFSPLELTNINNGVNTNYLDLLFRQGNQQEHSVGVAAGSDRTKVYLSMNYYGEDGILRLDDLKRYSGRLNLDQTLGKIARTGMQMQFTYYNINSRTSPIDEASKIAPFSLPYDSLGNVVRSPNNDAARWNPLSDEGENMAVNNTRINRTLAVAYLELMPAKGLSLRSNLGVVFSNNKVGAFYDNNSLLQRGQGALANYTSSEGRNTTWENVLTYNRNFNDHNFTLTGISSFLQNNYEEVSAQGNKQILPSQLYYSLGNATEGITIRSGFRKENLVSFAGRVNYSYKGKYLASVSVRSDGSSKLAEGNKWDIFPSAAVAWRISDESFLANSRTISDLKLRVSYGVTGSDAIPAYRTQSSLVRIPGAFGENPALGFAFSDTIGNPNLKWEKTKAFNAGIDLSLFNNRLTASIDFYETRTFDLLVDRLLPATSGVSRTFENIGGTSNTGIDIALNAAIIRSQNLDFNAGITFYSNKERITNLVNGVDDVANNWFIGSPVRVVYDYRKIGIWQMGDSTEAKSNNQRPGDIRVADVNGDKQITTADREVIGQLVPKWNAGLNLDLRFYNFDVNAFIFARMGQTIQYDYYTRLHLQGRENGALVNYWTPENGSNEFPRPRTTSSFVSLPYSSTLGYVDGSFVKLRNITLGYRLPAQLLNRAGISGARIYVTGKNLLSFSKLDDYDVERGGSLASPLTRLIIAGVNVDF
jgi:TonB-linked SusC/RagA family outer membrane protein